MTISTQTRKAGPFIGPSNALNFPFHFKVFSPSDVAVFRETNAIVKRLVLTTDYSVTLSATGGTVTLKTALASDERLVIESAVPLLQPLQLEDQGGFYPHVLNDAFDRSCMQIQQLAQTLNRAVLVPETSDTQPAQLVAELQADVQAAKTAQTQMQALRNQTEAFRNEAQQWADNNENQAVETGKYSAKHWAAKAQQTASSVNAADIQAQFADVQAQFAAQQAQISALQTDLSVNAADLAAQISALQSQVNTLQGQVNTKPPQRQWADVKTQRQQGTIYTNTSTQEMWVNLGFDANGRYYAAHVAANSTAPFIKVGSVPFYDAALTFVVPPGGCYKVEQVYPTVYGPTIWLEYSDL